MPQRPSHRLYLADLVLAALMCGLIASLFTSARTPVDGGLVFFLISAVAVGWSLFHDRRRAPTCEECGRRFIRPKEAVRTPASCPHCGREQIARNRWIRRVQGVYWGLLGWFVASGAVAAAFFTGFTGGPHEGTAMFAGMIAAGSVQLTLLAWMGVGVYLSGLKRPKERPCDACGSIIPLEQPTGSMTCPQCRLRHLRPDEVKRERARSLGIILILLGIISFLGVSRLPGFGLSRWIDGLLLALASMATLFFAFVAILVSIQYLRRRQLRSKRGALAMARKCAGRDGEVVEEGPWTIWYSGPDDPMPMLRDQMAVARRRFGTLTGEEDVTEPPRLVLVFHDRGDFLTFHRRIAAGIDFSTFDGLHLGLPYRLITLCTAPAPCRLTNPGRLIRSLSAYALLEAAWGPGSPAWLQTGLSRSSGCDGDRDELVRLNRKMVAAISLGAAWSVEMFAVGLKGLTRLIRGSKDPCNIQKFHQFQNQAWSIVEYLCGEPAPQDRRESLGAFLRDARSKVDQEESFRIHFGLDFGTVLEGWRIWVLDRGIGSYEPPLDRIRDGLLERVVPAIRDGRRQRGDRIVAIREWANLGFILGADALIDLLRDPGDIPKEEIVWALCMVSGMAWGDDPDRWQSWWDALPSAWDEPPEAAAATPSAGLPIESIAAATESAPVA